MTWAQKRPAAMTAPAVLSLATLVAACAGPSVSTGPGGLSCLDDSPTCMAARKSALADYMADSSRSWIRQPATPAAYASGVRLFAFKQQKARLSCDELAIATREADAAPAVLRGPNATDLKPWQVSRGLMLADEVARELKRERRGRCRA